MTWAVDSFAFEADLLLGEDLLNGTLGAFADPGPLTRSALGTLWTPAPEHVVPRGFDELRLALAPNSHRVIGASAMAYLDTPEETETRARDNAWSLTALHGVSDACHGAACVRYRKDLGDGRRLQLACYRNARIVALRLCMTAGHPEFDSAMERRREPVRHPAFQQGALLN